jgi:hypothetical protein
MKYSYVRVSSRVRTSDPKMVFSVAFTSMVIGVTLGLYYRKSKA